MGFFIIRMDMGNKNLKSYVSGPVSKASLALIFTAAVGMSVFADWYGPGRAEAAPTANGMVVYSNNSTTPQYRSYTAASNTFGAQTATLVGAAQTFVVTKSATTRDEKMAGYVTTGGVLYIMRWDGSAWSNEWNVTVGGNGVDGRRFDITYENTSGNAMVAYSTNATGTTGNEIAYRIWNGSTWTAATNINSARLWKDGERVLAAKRFPLGLFIYSFGSLCTPYCFVLLRAGESFMQVVLMILQLLLTSR